jgi:GDP-L-fucose synthase
MVKQIVGFEGDIITDTTKPDGTPRKLMDVSKLTNLGWKASISLEDGIQKVYEEIKDRNWSE